MVHRFYGFFSLREAAPVPAGSRVTFIAGSKESNQSKEPELKIWLQRPARGFGW
jgi:hypothetical protein